MSEDIVQGSTEWLRLRSGKVTASRIAEVVAKTKTGYSSSRSNYLATLLVERLTGEPTDTFQTAAMAHGTATEPEARAVYEFWHNVEVQEVGFIHHPGIAMSGCSPDGVIGEDGLLEIKCPQPAAHIETLLTQTVPDKYTKQMAWQMAVTGRKWCDYVSYQPSMPEHMRLFVKRVERDDKLIAELEAEVVKFLAELDDKLAALNALYATKEAAE